jgi:hypothetical protein
MVLNLTHHAIEQFIARWRPDANQKQAEEELREMLRFATPCRRTRLVTGNALLYRTLSEEGEHIFFAVREAAVITVLPPRNGRDELIDLTPDPAMVDESDATVAACRAIVEGEGGGQPEPRFSEAEMTRRLNARALLNEVEIGRRRASSAAIKRAKIVLGLAPPDAKPKEKP